MLCGGLTRRADVILPILDGMLAKEEKAYKLSVSDRAPVWSALRLAGMPKNENEEEER